MNSDLEALEQQVNAIQQEARELVSGLSDKQAAWSPKRSVWSISACIEHISVSAKLYLLQVDKAIERGRSAGLTSNGPFRYRAIGRWLIRNIEPPPKLRVRTSAAFRPAANRPVTELLAELQETYDHVRQSLHASDGLDLVRIRMRHPTLSFLRFSLGVGFSIMTGHARRHLWQARQVSAHPAFPK